jgi:hypothetical protein
LRALDERLHLLTSEFSPWLSRWNGQGQVERIVAIRMPPVRGTPVRLLQLNMFNKVFCIGFNKTGTTSLHRLLTAFGLKSWHGFYSHIYDTQVEAPLFQQYQCFSDGELHDFQLLDRSFPGSKFILTTRPFDEWLVSRIRHVENRRIVGGTGPMRREYDASPSVAVKAWIEDRLRHHGHVAQYFSTRRNDLLVINICDNRDRERPVKKIAHFLGIEPPDGMVLPHENVTTDSPEDIESKKVLRKKAEVLEEVRGAFREMDLPAELLKSVFP